MSLEETGVERKGQKTDGIVSTVLSGDVAIIASITHLVKCYKDFKIEDKVYKTKRQTI